MRLNRRNVLIGLGTIVAGGGAALGTGAFSSVEATRDVDINRAGNDSSALLELSIEHTNYSGVTEPTEDTISFDTENLNEDATTSFDDVLTISHSESATYDITVSTTDPGLTFYEESGDSGVDDLTINAVDSSGTSIGITVNTTEIGESAEITIEAEETA